MDVVGEEGGVVLSLEDHDHDDPFQRGHPEPKYPTTTTTTTTSDLWEEENANVDARVGTNSISNRNDAADGDVAVVSGRGSSGAIADKDTTNPASSALDATPTIAVGGGGSKSRGLRLLKSHVSFPRKQDSKLLCAIKELQFRGDLRTHLLKPPKERTNDELNLMSSALIRLAPNLFSKLNLYPA